MKRLAYAGLSLALIAGAAACGDNITDAGGLGVDSGVDSDVVTSGTCGMVVATTSSLEDVVGAPVMFSRPDGTLIGVETAGIDGMVSRPDCVRDTMLTIAIRDGEEPQDYELFTYTHINPGDTVYFLDGSIDPPGIDEPKTDLNIALSQDVDALTGEIDGVGADVGCNSRTTEGFPTDLVVGEISRCSLTSQDDNSLDVLAYVDGPGGGIGGVKGYSFVKGVPLVRGTSTMNVETPATVPPWTAGNLDNAFIVSNVPAGAYSTRAGLRQIVGGLPHERASMTGFSGGLPVVSTTFRGLPEGFGEQSEGSARFFLGIGGNRGDGEFDIDRWKNIGHRGPFVRTFFLDLAEALPTIAALVVTEATSLRPTIQWILDDSTTTDVGNFGIFAVRFWNGDGTSVGSSDTVEWWIVTPDVGAGSFRFPELPPQLVNVIEPFTVQVVPEFASLNDAGWLANWSDIFAAPGFDPEDWDRTAGVVRYLPQPEASAERRFRRSSWQRDDD